MQETTAAISAATAIQELGVTGILALSNIASLWFARLLWNERAEKEKQLHECLKNKG